MSIITLPVLEFQQLLYLYNHPLQHITEISSKINEPNLQLCEFELQRKEQFVSFLGTKQMIFNDKFTKNYQNNLEASE